MQNRRWPWNSAILVQEMQRKEFFCVSQTREMGLRIIVVPKYFVSLQPTWHNFEKRLLREKSFSRFAFLFGNFVFKDSCFLL